MRTQKLTISLDSTEKQSISAHAARLGLYPSAWARSVLFAQIGPLPPKQTLPQPIRTDQRETLSRLPAEFTTRQARLTYQHGGYSTARLLEVGVREGIIEQVYRGYWRKKVSM